MITTNLPDSAFAVLKSGETANILLDIPTAFNINSRGNFEVFARGNVPIAGQNSNELTDSVSFESEPILVVVDKDDVLTEVEQARRVKRSLVLDTCDGNNYTQSVDALIDCETLATAGADAAENGPADR